MVASKASDIPESKVDYCPCNRCTVARKQGRQEIIDLISDLHMESAGTCLQCTEAETGGDEKWIEWHSVKYPCPTMRALGDK